ncbi:MFS transporter [Cohnella lupini]|uniref:Putative MFS family arabinose efflux permease n=1 Tax=Cohnella lupini TaxID=1294267 RepID=A0A3D9I2K1_9BACL|nr:MFS transporter [Cohnella lupini]RED56012.1 putative MFS family arabinose efflux permease [Cohnella lupini]
MRKYTALFFLVMFMIGTDTFLISPLLPTLQAQYGVSTGIAGWMIGSYTLGSALFALIAGPLSDGWNRRTVMLYGLLGFSVSTVLCGFADGFWTMCLFRFLAGVSAAFTAPQVWASIPAVMPASKIAKTMGIAFAGLAAAQALGVPIGSWLAVARWSVPFWTIGAASSLLIVYAYYALPDIKPNTREKTSVLRRYIPLIISGKARSGFLAYLLLHLGSGTAFAFVGKWMADRFELPIGQIGTVMMFLGFGTLLGSIVSTYATRKLGITNAVVVGMLLLMALYVVMPRLASLPFVTIVYFIIFVTLGIIFPIVMGALTSLNASIRGTISSLANSTMNGANTLGAWIAGVLYVQLGGYSSIGIFSAICLAFSLGTFLFGGVLERKPARISEEPASVSETNT